MAHRVIDVSICRAFAPQDGLVSSFIEHLEREDKDFFSYYLVWLVLNAQIGKFMGHSPIHTGDYIHHGMSSRIAIFTKSVTEPLNAIEAGRFLAALQRRLRDDEYPAQYMKFELFEPVEKPTQRPAE